MQCLIFSRTLIEDAYDSGYLTQLDEMFGILSNRGIGIAFITQKPWELPKGLQNLETKVRQFKTKNRQQNSLASTMLGVMESDIKRSIILASNDADIVMGANSGVVCVTASWLSNLTQKLKANVLGVKSLNAIPKIFDLVNGESPWFSVCDEGDFKIFSMVNAGDYGNIEELIPLVGQMRDVLKTGDNKYAPLFKFFLASSVMKTEELREAKYVGVFPSSAAIPMEEELIFKYYDVLRYLLKKRLSKYPLLVRHKKSPKRHAGEGGDRNDPNPQLNTLHIHPWYKGRLKGETVIIIDDYVNNGTSFRVADALLKKAGVKKVLCIAMGKWGQRLHKYEIDLNSRDPFKPEELTVDYKAYKYDESNFDRNALQEILEKYEALKK